MPELPEVETIKETLKPSVLHKTIKKVTIYWERIIQYPEPDRFSALLQSQEILDMKRRGKYLLFYLTDDVLISHLRMEGKYGLYKKGDPIDAHTHVIFRFTDDTELRYKDVRKFGTMHLYRKGTEFHLPPLHHLGPEPFSSSFNGNHLYERFQKTERVVKNVLLDQRIVAGLGNIYVDEVLYRCSIHPNTKARNLSFEQCETLAEETKTTLREAINAGGTTIRTYVNTHGDIGLFQLNLYVYGQEGKSCKQCGVPIEKIKVGGRGTHFCPGCQGDYQEREMEQ